MNTILKILDGLGSSGNLRKLPDDSADSALVDLSSNDYLGLAQDIELRAEFLERLSPMSFFPTSSASRLLSSHQKSYSNLEHRLAELYGRPALLFNSGYHANTGLISALGGKNTLFVADKLVHASIIDGLVLSGSTFQRFAHNNYEHLERILCKSAHNYDRVVIVVESVYSMDGDACDICALAQLKKTIPNALLYVDEAHAVGVCGPHGLGLAVSSGMASDVDIIVGTFGKALASAGAFAIMNDTLRRYMINRSRSLIFSTSLPPVVTDWSLVALNRALTMDDSRKRLQDLSQKLHKTISAISGERVEGIPSHIQPYIIGDAQATLDKSSLLMQHGYKVLPIRTPTVPPGTERLRFSLSAAIRESDLDGLEKALVDVNKG